MSTTVQALATVGPLVPSEAANVSDEQATAEAAAAEAQRKAEAERKLALAAADSTMDQAQALLRDTELDYTSRISRVCGLTAEFVGQSVRAGCTREYAVGVAAGKFSEALRREVSKRDVNDMIRVHYARAILDPDAAAPGVYYSHYLLGWSKLIGRDAETDKYSILPGVQVESQVAFRELASGVANLEKIQATVNKLVRDSAAIESKRKATESQEATEKAAAQAKAKREAQAALEEAQRKTVEAERVAGACPDDKEAQKARDDAEKAERQAKAEAEEKERQSRASEREKNKAAQQAKEAAARAEAQANKGEARQPVNLLSVCKKSAERGTPKDRAEGAVELLASGDGPKDAMEHFMRLACLRDEFGADFQRHCKGILVLMVRERNAAKPESNGHVA